MKTTKILRTITLTSIFAASALTSGLSTAHAKSPTAADPLVCESSKDPLVKLHVPANIGSDPTGMYSGVQIELSEEVISKFGGDHVFLGSAIDEAISQYTRENLVKRQGLCDKLIAVAHNAILTFVVDYLDGVSEVCEATIAGSNQDYVKKFRSEVDFLNSYFAEAKPSKEELEFAKKLHSRAVKRFHYYKSHSAKLKDADQKKLTKLLADIGQHRRECTKRAFEQSSVAVTDSTIRPFIDFGTGAAREAIKIKADAGFISYEEAKAKE